jgi:uncharacterized protein YndB with AHSA1/START domain
MWNRFTSLQNELAVHTLAVIVTAAYRYRKYYTHKQKDQAMATDDSSIFIETTFKSSIEKIWEAWTNPNVIMKWFGSDPEGKGLNAELDVRPGGSFEITFRDADLTEHTCSGIYDEVYVLRKLTFSWRWKSEPGVESFVILLLTPEGKSTRMQFEHKNLGSGSKHNYAKGWQNTFSKLERLLDSNLIL